MSQLRQALLIIVTLFITSCSTNTSPEISYSEDFNFKKLRNFVMLNTNHGAQSDHHQRIAAELNRDLLAKGFQNNHRAPDFMVDFHLYPDEADTALSTCGSDNHDKSAKNSVSNLNAERHGWVKVTVYDQSRKVIWQGKAHYHLPSDPNNKDKALGINAAINSLLKQFPPGSSS